MTLRFVVLAQLPRSGAMRCNYMNGVYSEDLLTATAATFWDVERIEVCADLRAPFMAAGVGGAINILYKQRRMFRSPSKPFRVISTQDYYGAVSGPWLKARCLT